MKTRNLTQKCAWNDIINLQIKAFYCKFQKTKIQSSSGEFFILPWWNINFKHSSNTKMSLE